jgi:UDP-N-acetylmuramate-alanine ligase/UDP-N-acetylglucosamine:LPS N-acetylglucosamine transferase
VTFAGSPDRVESRLVPEAGFELDTFSISGFPRRLGLDLVRSVTRAVRAPFACSRILARRKPDVVLGGGGYVAGPMVLAARLRGIPAALTEADAHLGLANRLAAPAARHVFLAYGIPGRDGAKYEVVGRPIPVAHLGSSRADGRERFGLPLERPVLAVFGGLAGAHALNELAVDTWGSAGPAVLHISGERDYAALRPRVTRADYVLVAQTHHFGDALAAADVALSRAGGTVWELAAAGTPAILVPYPYATADHQTLNARHFERGGGAIVVDESSLVDVPALVAALLDDSHPPPRPPPPPPLRPPPADERRDAYARAARRGTQDRRRARGHGRSGGSMSSPASLPLAGRRLYFVGIAGAGLSSYANFTRAWGAEVRGWDARDTIFSDALDPEIEVDVGGEPSPPPGFEVVVSTAHLDRADGAPRAELLAELVRLRPSIVAGGAHGKTTTAAMIAYVLRELDRDPAWIVGGVVPQLGGNAGTGSGWLVVEGDESDRSIALLEPKIAVVTNVEVDHHATYASEAELAAFFDGWLAGIAHVVRAWELDPVELELAVPGEHNLRNATAALAALELAGVDRADAERAIAGFAGVDRRFQLVGEVAGVSVYDDYGHNPTEIAATLRTARERTERELIAVYQPHVYERTRQLAAELGESLGLADVAVVTDVIGGRDAPRLGVTGKLVLDRVPVGVRRGWAPTLEDAGLLAAEWARPGDVVVTLGVGEPWRIARTVVERLGGRVETA